MGTERRVSPGSHRARALGWLLATCMPWPAQAIDPQAQAAHLHRSEWTRLQGAPAEMNFVVTASDGMVWLGGSGGLYRFDGVHFHRFASFDGDVLEGLGAARVQPDDDGGLWLGRGDGHVLHVRGQTVTRHAPVKDLHTGALTDLAVDNDGRIWVVTKSGLSMFDGRQWRGFGDADGLGGMQVDDVSIAPDGRIWVLTDTGVFVAASDIPGFVLVEAVAATSHMAGLLTTADTVWRWTVLGDENLCRVLPRERCGCWKTSDLIFPVQDAHGALWWESPQGVKRAPHPDRLGSDPDDLERQTEVIASDGHDFSFGHDGSVWVLESNGIARLRETPLQHLRTPTGALAPANDGTIWLGSFTRGLMRVGVPAPGTRLLEGNDQTLWTDTAVAATADISDMMTFAPVTEPPPAGTPVVLSRHPDANARTTVRLDPMPGGGVRFATLSPPRLVEYDGTTATELPLPPLDRGIVARGAQRDARGDLWLAVARNTVPFFRLRDGQWAPNGGIAGVDKTLVNGLHAAGDTVWIAIGNNAIGRVQDERWTRYGPEQGVALGQAHTPLVHEGQLWVAGSSGFQALVGDRFVSIVGSDGDRFIGATGALVLDNGDLWLNGVAGLSRIERRAWKHALRDPDYRVPYTRLDHFDGNMSAAMQGAPLPTLVRSSDGMLWATTDTELLRIDPAAVRPALPAPAAQLLSLVADDAVYRIEDGTVLPVGATRIGLTFTAPPLDSPEHVRFRYRLQGGDWVDAGNRREVMYEALPPGKHVFEVAASDREGRWNETPTRLAFVLPPRFHQTIAFQVLIGLAVATLLAAIYAIRMRQIAERTQRDTTARLHERMRISRDLHDTLLQSVQALHMHVQAIAARVPAEDPMRTRIDLVLERAHDTIREGRDRISALRDPLAGTSDLADCLQRIAQRLAREADVLCEVQIEHPPRALQPMVYDELLHMGREALTNALQHAQASRVTLRIAFAADGIRITVADDGAGFPSEVLQHGGRDGHFGMRGMRERAALAGAELHVHNIDGTGAEVVIRVPAQRAYLREPRAYGWLARLWHGRRVTSASSSRSG